MDCRTSLSKLFRTAHECCQDDPKMTIEYFNSISDEVIDCLQLTEVQQANLNKLWSSYRKGIGEIIAPTIDI
jgi:hypothetical protein